MARALTSSGKFSRKALASAVVHSARLGVAGAATAAAADEAVTSRSDELEELELETVLMASLLAAVADAGKEFLANGSLGDVGLLFAAVTAGVGLILAKDAK